MEYIEHRIYITLGLLIEDTWFFFEIFVKNLKVEFLKIK
jgi:hypothetical protein